MLYDSDCVVPMKSNLTGDKKQLNRGIAQMTWGGGGKIFIYFLVKLHKILQRFAKKSKKLRYFLDFFVSKSQYVVLYHKRIYHIFCCQKQSTHFKKIPIKWVDFF